MTTPLLTLCDDRPGALILTLPGFAPIGFTSEAEIDGKETGSLPWVSDINGYRASNDFGAWHLLLDCKEDGGAVLTLSCELQKPAASVVLKPVVMEPLSPAHLLVHGRSMGGCGGYPFPVEAPETIRSDFFLSITDAQGHTLLLSHPLAQDHFSGFTATLQGPSLTQLTALSELDPVEGTAFRSAPVTLQASSNGHKLIEQWAIDQAAGQEPIAIPQSSGWNSWDYYRWTITEEEVLKNAEFIAADPVLSKAIDRIVIDDGWQYCYGEWEANSLFPSGMEALAQRIRRLGFTPGLWVAPTLVEPHSRIAQLDPDMMAMGLSGLPTLAFSCMRRNTLLFDPTRPRVKQWWQELFARYNSYGYRFFKLDFLAATLNAPRFHLPVPKGEMMRHILEPIRAALTPDTRLLGCNYQLQGKGLVDEVRVSADIHADWTSVKENVASIAARFWAHGRFWINDPDFALCRGDQTAKDPDLHRLKPLLVFVEPQEKDPAHFFSSIIDLNHRQAEVLLSLVIVSGGAMNLSDALPRLNAAGLELLRKAVAAEKGAAAIPLDLFSTRYPAYWAQKLSSGLHRLLLINWGETPAPYQVDLSALNFPLGEARNFWSGEPVPVKSGRLEVELPPHGCLLLEIR